MPLRSMATAAQRVVVPGGAGTTEVHYTHGRSDHALIFFEGDQIQDSSNRDMLGPEFWMPQSHLETLRSHTAPETSLFVVMPTAVTLGGQACYGNFLDAMTAAGEPLGFKPQGYRAASHLDAILSACGYRCSRTGVEPEDAAGGCREVMTLTLVGFSKGAVVLNQLLAEMAWLEEVRGDELATSSACMLEATGAQLNRDLEQASRTLSAAQRGLPPVPVFALLDRIEAVHFLDAGLNTRGVHLTDVVVTKLLGRRHTRRPFTVHLHGTPRQWGDHRRPWIATERDQFHELLEESGIPVVVHKYFEGQPPSLRQHFEVIRHMRLVSEQCQEYKAM